MLIKMGIEPSHLMPNSSNPNEEPEWPLDNASFIEPAQIVCFDPKDRREPCPICRGIGLIKLNVPVDDPRFGKLHRCPNYPLEADEHRRERMQRLSNLGAFADKTFDTFQLDFPMYKASEAESLRRAFLTAYNYAEQGAKGWLLLKGSYGSGKTHLAAAVGNARIQSAELVLFITVPDLLDHLRSTYSPQSDVGYDALFERVRNASLLILDDLGVENPSPWAQEKLFQLLNHRYTHRLSTVITTNTDLDTLDPRLRSRLLDTNLVKEAVISAPDYRSGTQNKYEQLELNTSLYNHLTFDTLDPTARATRNERQLLQEAIQKAKHFAEHPHGWFVIRGQYGSGKTHMAAAIGNAIKYSPNNGDVLMTSVPDLLDYLRGTFDSHSAMSYNKLFNMIREVPVLILDDVGEGNTKSAWAQEKLFQLLDYRHLSRMTTILTIATNLHLNERLYVRLANKNLVTVVYLPDGSFLLKDQRL